MKFSVSVERTCWEEATFDIEANSIDEAEAKAIELAGNHEFGSGNAEYAVTNTKQIMTKGRRNNGNNGKS